MRVQPNRRKAKGLLFLCFGLLAQGKVCPLSCLHAGYQQVPSKVIALLSIPSPSSFVSCILSQGLTL